jgi:hypothetical protein
VSLHCFLTSALDGRRGQGHTPAKTPALNALESGRVWGSPWTGKEILAPSGLEPQTVQSIASDVLDYQKKTNLKIHEEIEKRFKFVNF